MPDDQPQLDGFSLNARVKRDGSENLDWKRDVDAKLTATRAASEENLRRYRRRQRVWLAVCAAGLLGLTTGVLQATGSIHWPAVPGQIAAWCSARIEQIKAAQRGDPPPTVAPRHELPPPTAIGAPCKPADMATPPPTIDPSGPPGTEGMTPGTVLFHRVKETGEKFGGR